MKKRYRFNYSYICLNHSYYSLLNYLRKFYPFSLLILYYYYVSLNMLAKLKPIISLKLEMLVLILSYNKESLYKIFRKLIKSKLLILNYTYMCYFRILIILYEYYVKRRTYFLLLLRLVD